MTGPRKWTSPFEAKDREIAELRDRVIRLEQRKSA
jgi:hypothetical protein